MNFQPSGESFCDWLTVSQTFPAGVLPEHCSDVSLTFDLESGEKKFESFSPIDHRGSFDTSIRVKSYGNRLYLSGNVGRYNRPDNVFGYSFDDCKTRANAILSSLGLPCFTDGEYKDLQRGKGDNAAFMYTGAVVSRVDMTTNFSMGDDASDFMHWLATQKISRSKNTAYEGECVYWGSIKYAQSKAYLKGEELNKVIARFKRKYFNESSQAVCDSSRECDLVEADLRYLEKLQQYCKQQGFIRHEVRFSERYLNQKGLKPWHTTHETLKVHYQKELKKMTERCEISKTVSDLNGAVRATYYDYLNGVNVKANLTKQTFYRHRSKILDLGIDIAEATTVRALRVKPKLVEVKAAEMPLFYQRTHPAAVVLQAVGDVPHKLYKRENREVL